MARLIFALTAVLAIAGCTHDSTPLPLDEAMRQADAASAQRAIVDAMLLTSLDDANRAWVATTRPDHAGESGLNLLADPNDAIALAAARAAGRASMRNDFAKANRAVTALAVAMQSEGRPAVLAAQVESLVNLIANRGGLPDPIGQSWDNLGAALQTLENIAHTKNAEQAYAAQLAENFTQSWSIRRPARLGGNVYDGPGWQAERVKAPPRKRVAAYSEPIHTVPIIAAGELHIGDANGDGAADYLIIDNLGRDDGLYTRVTLYDHATNLQAWSFTLAGDDRPAGFPPGELADLDGDGRAEIVYVDRAGRIVIRNGDGKSVRQSDPFRTLDGVPYFGPIPARTPTSQPGWDMNTQPGRIRLANLRGDGRRDLLLTRGNCLLAMTASFQILWHVTVDVGGLADVSTLIADLDGDGTDEIVRYGVAISHTGRVLWTSAGRPLVAAVGTLAGHPAPIVLLTGLDGRITALDARGPLWQATAAAQVRQFLVGRFVPAAGVSAAVVRYQGWQEKGIFLDGLGRMHLPTARLAASPPTASPPVIGPGLGDGMPLMQVDELGLVTDWRGDGIDAVWGHEKSGIPGWFTWPAGQIVERIPQAKRVIGLFDVDGDGVDELLYFQGDSLVIHRR